MQVRVWDHIVRATHWLAVLSFVVLGVTGFYLGSPFLIAAGRAGDHFVMGTAKVIHFYAAIAFSLAVLARLVWMFRGPAPARWDQFIPVDPTRRRGLLGTLKFYLLLQPRPPAVVGHNPLAGLSYCAVFFLYLVMIASGMAIYGESAAVGSYTRAFAVLIPLFGSVQGARWIHHVVMWLLIGFTVHHVYSALLTSRVEQNGTLDSIFSGFKYLPRPPRQP